MSDLVKRLRDLGQDKPFFVETMRLVARDAADRLEKLEAVAEAVREYLDEYNKIEYRSLHAAIAALDS